MWRPARAWSPFAGYDMPVQYRDGVLKEHLWTREHAGAFDVSHMGPCFLTLNEPFGRRRRRPPRHTALIEPLVSGDIASLKPGQIRYTLLLAEDGGIIDDLMVGRPLRDEPPGHALHRRQRRHEGGRLRPDRTGGGRRKATLARADDRALIAVQGPQGRRASSPACFPEAAELVFMTHRRIDLAGEGCVVARSGYTGEDGFEILVRAPACAGRSGIVCWPTNGCGRSASARATRFGWKPACR